MDVLLKVTFLPISDINQDIADGAEHLLFTDVVISKNFVLPVTTQNPTESVDSASNSYETNRNGSLPIRSLVLPAPVAKITVDSFVYSNFLTLLTYSKRLRTKFLRRVFKCQPSPCLLEDSICNCDQQTSMLRTLEVTVIWPAELCIDYNWNYKVKELIYEYSELENLSAWLSTLGGAFSSLGETSIPFANKAQITSVHQMKIAHQLNNPLLMSRCRLFYAISLLQKNDLKKARKIVENEYRFAKSETGRLDFKLKNMCLGIWAKLKYLHQQSHHGTECMETNS